MATASMLSRRSQASITESSATINKHLTASKAVKEIYIYIFFNQLLESISCTVY